MNTNENYNNLYKFGAAAALLQLATLLLVVAAGGMLGARPESVEEYYSLMNSSRLEGILRDDFSSLILMGLYLGTIPALFAALRHVSPVATALASLFTLMGVVVGFSTHSGFSMLYLSDQYAAAASAAQRSQILAAGEAVLATNMWNSSGGYLAGMLLQGSGVVLSLVMLRSSRFHKATAYAGLLANAFDLAQHLLHPFAPGLSGTLILLSGPFYLVWFPILAWDLFRLGRSSRKGAVRLSEWVVPRI